MYVNELYALYHYLVREGSRPPEERNPTTKEAAGRAAKARHLTGVHGIWDAWEAPLASAPSLQEGIAGLQALMADTISQLSSALAGAQGAFHETVWPERQAPIGTALETIREILFPHFAAMARRQGELLGLDWPNRIDVYLVPDCYAWEGAYSHPLTVDVTANTGTTLCETLLHEATHVADVHTAERGRSSLGSRLMAFLADAGIPRFNAWNAWHGVIFASSADAVRTFIDLAHIDYAAPWKLYDRLSVPDLPSLWRQYAVGTIDESAFLERVATQVKDNLT